MYVATRDVPYKERLFVPDARNNEHSYDDQKKLFRLIPVGIQRQPDSVEEMRCCLICILTCLDALHRVGYVHCDIRWSNIIFHKENWYLVDCTSAQSLKDEEGLRKNIVKQIKSRYIFQSETEWTPRCDLYQVGLLIEDSNYREDFDVHRDALMNAEVVDIAALTRSLSVERVYSDKS